MERFAASPTYKVLQQDRNAHIVRDTESGLTSYVLFETPRHLPDGLIEHADTACLIMVRPVNENEAIVTVANPDLALYRGSADELFDTDGHRIERSIYSRPWISDRSQEIPVCVTIKSEWNISGNPACKIISRDKNSTVVQFTCKDAASFDVVLTK